MPDVRPSGALERSLRVLALAGALVAAASTTPPVAHAQSPADPSLCPPPPRRLRFAISAVSPARKPARRKPVAARTRVAGAAPVMRPARVIAKTVAVRPKKRARARSVVPVPRVSRPVAVARATGVCQPWIHELAAPLIGIVASAPTAPAQIPLVGAVGSPFPAPVAQDDSSSGGGWWWMIPAGGIAIAGAAGGGGGADGEAGEVAGVEVGRGSSGTPVVGAPVGVEPPVGSSPNAAPPTSGGAPGDGGAGSGPPSDGTFFAPLPPVPPVGSTTPPGGSGFTPPGGSTELPPTMNPDGSRPGGGGPPGGTVPGWGSHGTPGRPGEDGPGAERTPPVTTAVVPEPSPLSLVLVGGGLLSLVAWGAARRF